MQYTEFENLIGKHISFAKEIIGNDFDNEFFGENFFYIKNESITKNLFGLPYNTLSVLVNEKDTVQSVSVHFRKVLTRQFYDSFVEKYGKPNNIQIIENRQIESESIIKNDNGKVTQTLRKGTFNLREGSFDERPLYIIWKKETFNIKIFLRHEQNMSEITFSIK